MIKDAIVQRFQALCAQRELSYTKLARLAGVTPSTVYSMMSPERRDVSAVTVKKLCDGLEISLSEFFTDPVFDALPQEIE